MLKMIGSKYNFAHKFFAYLDHYDHIMRNCTLQGQIYMFVSLALLVVSSGVMYIDSGFVFESFVDKANTVHLLNDPQGFFYPLSDIHLE